MIKNIIVKVFVIFVLVFVNCDVSTAQIYLVGGINCADVRNDIVINSKKPIAGFNLGVSFKHHPFKNIDRLFVVNAIKLNQKGYQVRGDQKYPFRLFYLTLPVFSEHQLTQRISVNAGFEPAYLLFTNVMQGRKTYNRFDIGLIAGLNYEMSKEVSIFSLISYGLLPILDYSQIDEMGNFNNNIHDLENVCISIGLRIDVKK